MTQRQNLGKEAFAIHGTQTPVYWSVSTVPVEYADAITEMERLVRDIRAGVTPETVWVLEHPPVITAGTSAQPEDLLQPQRFPVFKSGRGGQFTYHGPGQLICYVMLDLQKRGGDVRHFVATLEEWLIQVLERLGVKSERREDRVGVWVKTSDGYLGGEAKIAAIGVRVRRGVSYHGISLNVCPDLSHFEAIVPCGVRKFGVTSLEALGKKICISTVKNILRQEFVKCFDGNTIFREVDGKL